MSFRLAAYVVCIEDERVLLAHHVSPAANCGRLGRCSAG